jgi:hypothetical protein
MANPTGFVSNNGNYSNQDLASIFNYYINSKGPPTGFIANNGNYNNVDLSEIFQFNLPFNFTLGSVSNYKGYFLDSGYYVLQLNYVYTPLPPDPLPPILYNPILTFKPTSQLNLYQLFLVGPGFPGSGVNGGNGGAIIYYDASSNPISINNSNEFNIFNNGNEIWSEVSGIPNNVLNLDNYNNGATQASGGTNNGTTRVPPGSGTYNTYTGKYYGGGGGFGGYNSGESGGNGGLGGGGGGGGAPGGIFPQDAGYFGGNGGNGGGVISPAGSGGNGGGGGYVASFGFKYATPGENNQYGGGGGGSYDISNVPPGAQPGGSGLNFGGVGGSNNNTQNGGGGGGGGYYGGGGGGGGAYYEGSAGGQNPIGVANPGTSGNGCVLLVYKFVNFPSLSQQPPLTGFYINNNYINDLDLSYLFLSFYPFSFTSSSSLNFSTSIVTNGGNSFNMIKFKIGNFYFSPITNVNIFQIFLVGGGGGGYYGTAPVQNPFSYGQGGNGGNGGEVVYSSSIVSVGPNNSFNLRVPPVNSPDPTTSSVSNISQSPLSLQAYCNNGAAGGIGGINKTNATNGAEGTINNYTNLFYGGGGGGGGGAYQRLGNSSYGGNGGLGGGGGGGGFEIYSTSYGGSGGGVSSTIPGGAGGITSGGYAIPGGSGYNSQYGGGGGGGPSGNGGSGGVGGGAGGLGAIGTPSGPQVQYSNGGAGGGGGGYYGGGGGGGGIASEANNQTLASQPGQGGAGVILLIYQF